MRPGLRPRPTYANVTATLALFIALGGGAYAATANSIGSRQLKKNAVSGLKVRDNSLTGADINESTLGKVPSAAVADTATNATTAAGSSALDKVTYKTAGGTAA